jgi:hypothetical protein
MAKSLHEQPAVFVDGGKELRSGVGCARTWRRRWRTQPWYGSPSVRGRWVAAFMSYVTILTRDGRTGCSER